MKLSKILPILPALIAMTVWYIVPIRDIFLIHIPSEDPWRVLCMGLTVIQWYSIVTAGIWWREPKRPWTILLYWYIAWAIQNAWEFTFLFQVAGNTKLDLYPIANIILMSGERARLYTCFYGIAALSIAAWLWGRFSSE